MGFAANLRRYRKAKGLTQEQLAHICGWGGQSRVANYEKGIRQPSLDEVQTVASALGVSVGELMGEQVAVPDSEDWASIKGYAQAVGLGDGVEAQEYAETHKLKFRADSLRRKRLNPDRLAVFYGKGDSMLPRIHPGDAILFDTSDTRPRDEALFVILTHGIAGNEYSVKRCRMLDDIVFFDALNPAGDHNWRKPRRMDDKRHPITIVGRVRWIGSWEG